MQVAIVSFELVDMKNSVALRVAKLQAECKCLICEQPLGDEPSIRGDHVRCYKTINRNINAGKITEAKAVLGGFMLPVTKAGRKPWSAAGIRLQSEN